MNVFFFPGDVRQMDMFPQDKSNHNSAGKKWRHASATNFRCTFTPYSTETPINHWVPVTYSTHSAAISLSSLLGLTLKTDSQLFQKRNPTSEKTKEHTIMCVYVMFIYI